MGKTLEQWKEECEVREDQYTVLFRLVNPSGAHTKGEFSTDTNYVWINLIPHETEDDLIETIVHESIHAAMRREDIGEDSEHNIIKHMNWAKEGWILDE